MLCYKEPSPSRTPLQCLRLSMEQRCIVYEKNGFGRFVSAIIMDIRPMDATRHLFSELIRNVKKEIEGYTQE